MEGTPWAVLMAFEKLIQEKTGVRPDYHSGPEKGRHLAATKKLLGLAGGDTARLDRVLRFWAKDSWEIENQAYPQRVVNTWGTLEHKLRLQDPSHDGSQLLPEDDHALYRDKPQEDGHRRYHQ